VNRYRAATVAGFLLMTVTSAVWAQTSPSAYCRQSGTDDTLRAVPASLVPAIVRLFHLGATPAAVVSRSTYFRCADRHVLVCSVGANLVCGKADTRRELAGVTAWCRENAGAANVPAYVTGHATIYLWRCDGTRPVAMQSLLSVDPRGFIMQNWKTMGTE
jgi:hypothetical protein